MIQFLSILTVITVLITSSNAQMLVGGVVNQNSSEFMDSAWKSVPEVNSESNDVDYLVPIKVISAQTQVVAGTNTQLEVLFGESTCQRNAYQLSQVNASRCPVKLGGGRAIYQVSIFSQPWMNVEDVKVQKVRDVRPEENI